MRKRWERNGVGEKERGGGMRKEDIPKIMTH